jgi:hypothetical protein
MLLSIQRKKLLHKPLKLVGMSKSIADACEGINYTILIVTSNDWKEESTMNL